eukprot:GGOE01008012.1.p1 GENE.GGOE01008012.1~~GGOE01008012.1.p1  ORF type:complete len:723 (+),score=192.87 GGOE01008012.1:83-2170(+)
MGNGLSASNDAADAGVPGLDAEYQLSLQEYLLTALQAHQELTAKQHSADKKAKDPTRGHGLDQWTVQQVCDFVEDCCRARYGAAFPGVREVVSNFHAHVVDGATVGQLQPEDWRTLCPYIGPRLWITKRLKEEADAANAAPPSPHPIPPRSVFGSRGSATSAVERRRGSGVDVVDVLADQRQRLRALEEQHHGVQVAWETLALSSIDEDDFMKVCEDEPTEAPRAEHHVRFDEPQVSHDTSVRMFEAPDPSPADVIFFLNSNPHGPAASRSILQRSSILSQSHRPRKASITVAQSAFSPPVTVTVIGDPATPCSTQPLHSHGLSPASPSDLAGISLSFARADADSGEQLPEEASSPSWLQLLLGRSRFSNQRLIDTPWRSDSRLPWPAQLWQRAVYQLLRALYFLFTCLRVGMDPGCLAFLCIPAVCTAVSYHQRWTYDFSPTIFISVVVFPLTFSVNAAYNRREQALQILGNVKAAALALYLMTRSWAGSQAEAPADYVSMVSVMIKALFRSYGHYLTATSEADRATILNNIYHQYVDLCFHMDLLRLYNFTPALLNQLFTNLTGLILCFEKLRAFSDYRTPCTLRSFFWSCMVVLSLLMGPYCASLITKYSMTYGYLVNVGFFWLLLCLNNIQRMLENPFSAYGEDNAYEDDINLVVLRGGPGGPSATTKPKPPSPSPSIAVQSEEGPPSCRA